MAKWNEYGLKTGTSARDEVLILDSDTNTNKRITVGDIQEFANGKMLEKENSTLSTEAKTLIGAINELDAKNDEQDESLEAIEKKFSSYVKKTDVDSTLSAAGSPADAKVVGERFKSNEKAIEELADKKITKFYASNQGNTHLPDSDKGKRQDMFLYGKSEQAQYKGKNLLKITAKTKTVNGVTFTVNEDGTVKVNGTATADTLFVVNSIGVEANKTYRLVGCPSGGSNATYNMVMQDTVNWSIAFDNGSGVNKSYSESYTIRVSIQIKSGVTVNNLIFKPMLTTDTTATYDVYEPYVGGIPSPNPEYPQEIKAVVNPVVKVRGRNLLNPTLGTETKNGVTCTANGDGTYTVNGTATNNVYFYLIGSKNITLNKAFKVVGCPTGGSNETYRILLYNNLTNKYIVENGNGTKVNINDATVFDQFSIALASGTTVNNITFKPMLTYDMDATYDDYEPYTEQSVTLPYTLYAIPVSTGGNVTIGGQQYVADYVDVEKGVLVRNVKKLETLKLNKLPPTTVGTHGEKYYVIGVKVTNGFVGVKTKGYEYIMCNNTMRVKQTDELAMNNNVITAFGFTDAFEVRFRPLVDDFPTVEKLNAYLSETVVLYCLATSESFDLTPEQIQAYKSLSTNYPVTNVEVSSEQLDGYTIFNYPISMAEGWNYVKQQLNDNRDYIYDMDLQSAEAYVNSEYAVALTELEVM